MYKKFFVCFMAFHLLISILSGCGTTGKQIVQQATTSTAFESSASMESTDASSSTAPDDPEALGRWLWQLNETKEAETFAVDYDLDMSIDIALDEEVTTEKMTTRVKQITREDGTITFQSEQQYLNSVTSIWYDDGMIYLSDPYGDYKAPMDLNAFRESYINDNNSNILKLDSDSFGTLIGEKTDTGYVLTYGDVALEAWMAFSGLVESTVSDLGIPGSCEDFTLEGSMVLDQDGYQVRHDMHITFAFDILGMRLTETLDLTQTVNNRNENVSISIPADDSVFSEMSDISIPSVFANGYSASLAQEAMAYQDTMALHVSDESINHTYIQQDDISYLLDDQGLTVSWYTIVSQDGTTVQWSSDSYHGGQGTIIDSTGETPYTYDDDSFGQDIANFITIYTDSFDYGYNYTLDADGDYTKLTYDLEPEYVEMVLDSYTEYYETGISLADASSITSHGTMTVWFDFSGLMVSQSLQCTSDLTLETGPITVSLEDNGKITAFGEDVSFPDDNY